MSMGVMCFLTFLRLFLIEWWQNFKRHKPVFACLFYVTDLYPLLIGGEAGESSWRAIPQTPSDLLPGLPCHTLLFHVTWIFSHFSWHFQIFCLHPRFVFLSLFCLTIWISEGHLCSFWPALFYFYLFFANHFLLMSFTGQPAYYYVFIFSKMRRPTPLSVSIISVLIVILPTIPAAIMFTCVGLEVKTFGNLENWSAMHGDSDF